jgi:hypothetical protein
MKKCTAIFLLSIFIFSNTEVHELGKMGVFMAHFFEHQAENPHITLLEFIQMHYSGRVVHDEDYERDVQLPFKTIDCMASGLVFTLPPQEALLLGTPPFPDEKNIISHYHPSPFCSSHLSDIWQPPKSC